MVPAATQTRAPPSAATVVALALSWTALGPASPAMAAPPEAAEGEDPVCEAPPRDEARTTGRYLATRAYKLFEAKDYVAAVKIWEQVLALLPELEPELRMLIAFAHREAYAIDGDAQHLRSAQQLFRAQLAGLAGDDVQRADVVAALSDVDATLEGLAEAERAAQERRDEAIRDEARSKLEAQYREERRREEAKSRRTYFALGGSLTGVGVGSFAAMTVFLIRGARLEQEGYTMAMVRPEEADRRAPTRGEPPASRCTAPAGASPVRVSARAPGSRPQARGEILAARAGRQEPPRREQERGPQHEVKPAASTEKQLRSRAAHLTAKATSPAHSSGPESAGGPHGVRGAARVQGAMRNRRGPSVRPTSGRGDSYKPKAKSSAGQRESEGVVVPAMAAKNNAAGGKGPCGGHVDGEGKREGMAR
ncbi:MAG: hypothetical protein R3B09_35665, partial [Nannocystaceae bacterium]